MALDSVEVVEVVAQIAPLGGMEVDLSQEIVVPEVEIVPAAADCHIAG